MFSGKESLHMKQCANCSKEFSPKSGKARFCSSLCRIAAHRKGIVTSERAIVTESLQSDGTCHSCHKPFLGMEGVNPTHAAMLCICQACAKAGATHKSLGVSCAKAEARSGYIPNWKRIGLKSREEGMVNILRQLEKDMAKILSHSTNGEAVFILGATLIRMT